MATFTDYVIRQGDTLELIAENTLGSAERWREIAVVNRMRAPFLSDEPLDQYGTPITTGVLPTEITAGATTYTLSLPVFSATYAANTVFYVQYYEYLDATTRSQAKYDAMVLSTAINETSGVLTFVPTSALTIQPTVTASGAPQVVTVTNLTGITFGSKLAVDSGLNAETVVVTDFDTLNLTITAVFTKSHVSGTDAQWGFLHTYSAGTTFYLFPPTLELATRVLRTGDVLRLPGGPLGSRVDSTGPGQFVNLLGTDVQIDSNGLVTFNANGQLTLVSGTKNLMQALSMRLSTPQGELPHHATYGNPLFAFIGHTGSPNFVNLAQALANQTMTADPRVNRTLSINTVQTGTTLAIDAQVEIKSASDLLRLDNIVIRIG